MPFLKRPFNDVDGMISPDGRWMAYSSDESGRSEVYVQGFPTAGGKWQVSTNGARRPRWKRDGKELFFLSSQSEVTAVEVQPAGAGGDFRASLPRALFKIDVDQILQRNNYDVTADGQQFLVNIRAHTNTAPITVVTNWMAAIKK